MVKRSLRRPPGAGAGLVVSGTAVIAVTYGLARYGFGLHLPQFRARFGLGSGAAGAIAAGSYLAYCLAAMVGRREVGRSRARTALWLAGGTAALGSAVVAVAWSAPVLAVGVLVAGSGAGAATPALVAAVAATVRVDVQPRAQAVVNSGTGAGVVAGGLLVLCAPAAWRWSWAGFAVLSLLVTWAADRRSRWPVAGSGGDTGGGAPLGALRRPLVAAVLAGAGCASAWTFGRDLMTSEGGLSDRATGLLWCLLGAAGVLGGLSGDVVARVGVRRAWIAASVVTATAVLLLAVLPGVGPAVAVALVGFGCGFVVLSGVLIAWAGDLVPEAAAQATAALFIGLTVGQAAGAYLLGVLADATTTPTAFVVAAGLVLASAAAAGRRAAPAARARVRQAVGPGSPPR
jgi:predicted MFS family arabinose efflux permease